MFDGNFTSCTLYVVHVQHTNVLLVFFLYKKENATRCNRINCKLQRRISFVEMKSRPLIFGFLPAHRARESTFRRIHHINIWKQLLFCCFKRLSSLIYDGICVLCVIWCQFQLCVLGNTTMFRLKIQLLSVDSITHLTFYYNTINSNNTEAYRQRYVVKKEIQLNEL